MEQTKSWHVTEQLNDTTWRIIEGKVINCYLLAGDERALLIDTGNGLGNIGEVVRSLTDLPVIVALTHRHCDHAGGIGWFDTPAYVHEADMCLSSRLFSTRLAARVLAARWTTAKDFPVQPFRSGYTALTNGAVFELGGRAVSVQLAPGHTRGSVIFLDDKYKMMFVGDNISHDNLWLHLPGATSVEEWIPTARQILKLSERYTVYSGHVDQPFDTALIKAQIECGEALVRSRSKNGLLPFKKEFCNADGQMRISYNPRNVRTRSR